MTRLEGWEHRFVAFLTARAQMPFAWGSNDCCTFAADCAEAITGTDPMADLRGYDSEIGAGRVLVRAGVESFEALVASRFDEVPIGMARRGDLALVMQGNEAGLMVVEGDLLAGPSETGLKRVPRDRMIRAWRVG